MKTGTRNPGKGNFQPWLYQVCRTDDNQSEIVETFRKLGFSVACTHRVGDGYFDLTLAKHGLTAVCEVKNVLKSPSARKFTPDQNLFNLTWQGIRFVVICKADCLVVARQFNTIIEQIKAAGIKLQIIGCQEYQYQPRLS